MSPIFAHGDLRLYLLSLLEERPLHGYGIMQALSERTGGTYTPSAGTIYPRLAKLENEGLVMKEKDGRQAVYRITDAGRSEVEARRGEIDDIRDGLSDSVRVIADGVRQSVSEAMKSLRADLAAAASEPARDEADEPDPRAASRAQLARAEAVVARFRAGVRADLRAHVARGGDLSEQSVTDLERRLESLEEEMRAAL